MAALLIVPVFALAGCGAYLFWGSKKPETLKDELESFDIRKLKHVSRPEKDTSSKVENISSDVTVAEYTIIRPEDYREYEMKIRPVIDELGKVLEKRNHTPPQVLLSQIETFSPTQLRRVDKPQIQVNKRDFLLSSICLGRELRPTPTETKSIIEEVTFASQIQNFSSTKLRHVQTQKQRRNAPSDFELQLKKRSKYHVE